MATEDWFDDITEFRPTAELIEQWIDEPQTRPSELNETLLLEWMRGIYQDLASLTAERNAKMVECHRLMDELDREKELSRDKDATIEERDAAIKAWQLWGRKVRQQLPTAQGNGADQD